MKKRRKFCGFLAFLVLLAVALIPAGKSQAAKLPALKVKGTKLMNSRGRTVQLKGVSTHGLSWYPQYVNQKAFTYMKKYWKINGCGWRFTRRTITGIATVIMPTG